MPCTSCMVDYSRSKKEFGCAKCKFSFCRKCLPYDVVIFSISSQPVPVCSNCYSLLNQQQQQNVESSKDKNREMPSNINCWNGEDLPPPSLRPLFSSNKTSKQNLKSNKNEWKELEERLERLNEPIESVKEEKKKIQGIGQLEERLAALRGVDVDIIRRPGLLVVNQDESQVNVDNERYENEVLKLLNEAEHSLQMGKRLPSSTSNLHNNSAPNNNLKSSGSNQDCSSINSSVINETIAQITASKKNENSTSSISSLDQQSLYPNLEDCVRKTLEDAKNAENEAVEFLRSHGQQQTSNNEENENNRNTGEQQTNNQQKHKNQNLQKLYSFFKKPLFR
uniref:Uncharacterized protein n=1 Tax=Meloidogyne enterolobii TaxID=390850 RepID=A0A6V7VH58_MELEN|nr:unnamed protein product [Meloidogyne enterolobii]